MINIRFNTMEESYFGFNPNEELLASVIRKAQNYVAIEKINKYWTTRVFDYEGKLAMAQRPWLIGATSLSLVILVLILVLFYRTSGERKRLAKLVAEETSTLTAIFDTTPDHIFCKDLDSRYTRCNKSFEEFFSLNKSHAADKYNKNALGMTRNMTEHFIKTDEQVFNQKQIIVTEETVPSPDGQIAIFEVIKSPLMQDGKVTGLVGMSRDITRRRTAEEEVKKAEEEAKRAYAEAENASQVKSRFIANMSHEMRTPMNVIVGLTDLMLEEDVVPDNTKETLRKINTAGTTLMGLINDVLDISKVEAGKMDLAPVQYDVPSLLNDIMSLNRIRIGEKPIVFKLDINEELPCTLFGDDLRIKQILNNLLSNAFKYTKEGTVTLQVRSEEKGETVFVIFTVSDTGIGIRGEDILKLFSDYNQVDTRANRAIEGTGLGLNITKKFVEMMGGEITVESEYGKGSTFRARIRQGFVSDTPIGKETVENLCGFQYLDNKKQAQKKMVRCDLSYARVLVVDDFPTNLDVTAGMLRKYKMQVDCVTSGQEAVDLIAAAEPVYKAVFMDHMMPGMDGVEATKLIRSLGTEYAAKIPIIALTANAVAGNVQMFLDNGFNAFLSKPFNAVSLDAVVLQWVKDK
jgi:PAS domain S-box-containing protein